VSPLSITLVLVSAGMHAAWNLFVRNRRPVETFLSMSVFLIAVALLPALVLEWTAPPVLSVVWPQMVPGAAFLAGFYLCMARSYGEGDFTVAYPLARGLPVLMVAIAEMALGVLPGWTGWLGIGLIVAGAVVLPLQSLRELEPRRYWNRATAWILLAACMVAGYTIMDSQALRLLPGGLAFALRYGILESALAGVFYWGLLLLVGEKIVLPRRPADWAVPALAICFVLGAYSLVLWAFQTGDPASYIIGLRQISIVLGVVLGAYFFRERGARLRIPAAVLITCGVALLSIA
jgi:drug/metabolite transporter (DMT)-like permease